MNGEALYTKYTKALHETRRLRWDGERYVLAYPNKAPVAWPFLTDDEKETWRVLAQRVNGRRR